MLFKVSNLRGENKTTLGPHTHKGNKSTFGKKRGTIYHNPYLLFIRKL